MSGPLSSPEDTSPTPDRFAPTEPPPLPWLRLLRRLFWPERVRLFTFTLCLALGIGSLFAVGNLLSMVERGLYERARELLGADLTLSAARPLEGALDELAAAQPQLAEELGRWEADGGSISETIEFASMAAPQARARQRNNVQRANAHERENAPTAPIAPPFLVALKGVEAGYPLRGALELSPGSRPLSAGCSSAPPASPCFPALMSRLGATQRGLGIGDRLVLGRAELELVGLIEREPAGGFSGALAFAPRVLSTRAAIDASGLLLPGARIRYQRLFALPETHPEPISTLARLRAGLAAALPPAVRVQSYLQAQPNTQQLFERIGLFLAMVGLSALALSLLALGLGLWGLINDQLPMIATLRCMGLSGDEVRGLYLRLCLALGLIAALLGLLLGGAIDLGLASLASGWLGAPIPFRLDPAQAVAALLAGALLSLTLNWAALSALAAQRSQALWRADHPTLQLPRRRAWGSLLLITAGATLYLWWLSGSGLLALLFTGSLGLLAALTAAGIAVAFIFLRGLLRRRGARLSWAPRFALRQLIAHRQRSWVGLFTLTIALSLVGALDQLRESFQRALTIDEAETPDHFLIDVQPDQRAALGEIFRRFALPPPPLSSLTRARLTQINGASIRRDEGGESPAARWRQRALTREYNLTGRDQLSAAETVSDGSTWSDGARGPGGRALISLEERWARRLAVSVGDRLTFDIQGRSIEGEVANLRAVNWLRLEPNFLVSFNEAALAGAPKSYIGAFQLRDEAQSPPLLQAIFEAAPNISVIDLRPIFGEARRLLAALASALQLIAGACALAGLLLIALSARLDRPRRIREDALLGALGVEARARRGALRLEQLFAGALTALLVLCGVLLLSAAGARAMSLPLALSLPRLALLTALALAAPLLAQRTLTAKSRGS